MPSLISDALGFPTTYDTGISILSDDANIINAFRYYHYGLDYNGSGTVGGIEKHFNDVYTYIDSITSNNIITVGTITTGTWNGDVISGQYGGTGVANTGKTITIGGNFATVGNYNLTLTLTSATNVTLPTSGTLLSTSVTALLNLVEVGTITTGTWNATAISPSYGGTGLTSYTIGDLVYASSTTQLSKLAAVGAGSALISNGVGASPVWGKINLSVHTEGSLPVIRGGTGNLTLPTNGQILIGDGTGYLLNTISGGTAISVTNGTGTITINNTGVTSVNGLTGAVDASGILAAVRARTATSVTTTLIGASTDWYGFITLGYSYRIISVETSSPARVRLYDTDAHRYTDATRPIGVDPVGEHGVMMDMITETGNLNYTSNPAIDGYNNESPISTSIPITVTNLNTGSATITITLTYLRTE